MNVIAYFPFWDNYLMCSTIYKNGVSVKEVSKQDQLNPRIHGIVYF